MNCPRCAENQSRVLQTRQETPESTIRQRICRCCGQQWFTLEVELPEGSVKWLGSSLSRKEGFQHIKFF